MDHLAASGEDPEWLSDCIQDVRNSSEFDNISDTSDRQPFPEAITLGTEDGRGTVESEESIPAAAKKASKPHSTPLTLKWLEENYEFAEGVCIPRSTLYVHYLDYCVRNDTQPVNAASFGKIIRQQFPQITTRRLGTRGQSKYHYYGIGVKETSSYYDIIYSAKGVQSSNGGKKDGSKQIIAYSPRSKLGTLLPEFPEIKDIKLPPNIAEDKVLTFLMMYRTHCQRILDTVIRANFDEVQSFLLHFWQGMPGHIQSILECKAIITLVGVCDSILYKAIASVLMPTVLQALPDSLTQVIRNFAKQLDEWLSVALDSLPENLQKVKFDLSRRFSQVLKRQASLNHLCQAARTVIHSSDITSQMLEDWLNVDLNSIIKQTFYTMDNYNDVEYQSIIKLSGDFEALLEDQAPLESYMEWLDKMVDKCVVQPSRKHPGSLRRRARQFLLMWSCFGTRIIRDMTLHSAPSFGSFHLLHLMFDDYVLYLVESLHSQERHQEFLRAVKGEDNVDILDDIALPDPSRIRESLSHLQETAVTTESQPERGSVITNTRETLANVIVGGSRTNNLPGHPSQLTLNPRDEESAMNEDFVDQSQNTSYGNVNPAYRSLATFPSFGQPLYSTQSTFRTQSSADMGCFSYSESGSQAQIGQLPYFDNQSLEKPNPSMYDWQQRPLPVSGINSSTGRMSDGKDYSAFTNQTRLPSVESLNYGYYESSQRDASCSIPNVLQATSQNIYGLYL